MAGALTVSVLAASGCRKAEETTRESSGVSSSVTSTSASVSEQTGPSETDPSEETTEPQDPTEREAKARATELGLDPSALHGKYDLFLKYSDCIVNNPKLGDFRGYALHLFPMVADHLSSENEEFFLSKLKDLKMDTCILDSLQGQFSTVDNAVSIYGEGIVYEYETTYATTFHELTHFVDAYIDGEIEDDVCFTGEKFIYRNDLSEEEKLVSDETLASSFYTSFITEGGAELYSSKYFSKSPRNYYCESCFMIGLELIYGCEKAEDLFFSHDSTMQFIHLMEDAGYSGQKICNVFDSFNYSTYSHSDRPSEIVCYEDVLVDLYEHAKGKNWKEDKAFCRLLNQIHNGYSDAASFTPVHEELQDVLTDNSKAWNWSEAVLDQVDEKQDSDYVDTLCVMFFDGKPSLSARMTRSDGPDDFRPTAICIDYDFDQEKVLSYQYCEYTYPQDVPERLASGKELDQRLLSFSKDNSASHQQTPFTGKPEMQTVYDRAAEIGNKYGVRIFLGENVPEYVPCIEDAYNADSLNTALDHVDRVLSKFPEGFFDQFNYGSYSGLDIALANRPLSYSDLLFNVCTTEDGYYMTCALDCTDNTSLALLESHLIEQIFLAIECRIEHYFENFKEPSFSGETWATYNPQEFHYTGYIYREYEKGMYDHFKNYVVSSSAMVSPSDDRAKLMTALMNAEELTEPCQKKAEYYSRCIREAFDDSSWPEKTTWEEALFR